LWPEPTSKNTNTKLAQLINGGDRAIHKKGLHGYKSREDGRERVWYQGRFLNVSVYFEPVMYGLVTGDLSRSWSERKWGGEQERMEVSYLILVGGGERSLQDGGPYKLNKRSGG